MSSDHSITQLISDLKVGDQMAAQRVWQRYVDRLIRTARTLLGNTPRRCIAEEDVVVKAFDGFFRAAKEGRYVQLNDRHDLWQLLVVIAERRVWDQRRTTPVPNPGQAGLQSESRRCETDRRDLPGVRFVTDTLPDEELALQTTQELGGLLGRIGSGMMRQVALEKMNGHSNAEIALKLNISIRSVERKLAKIRSVLQGELQDDPG